MFSLDSLKRAFDIIVAAIALTLFCPVLLLLAVLLRLRLGWPIFFHQIRPGYQGRPFKLIKLRTMTDCRDNEGVLLPDAERLTTFGRLLRATSLDELPELWNVLKGEMSLVGPRPLLMEYLPLYNERQARRHEVRPGMTGWAQVNGRNAISWEERLEMDVWYVDNCSFWLDLKILWLTVFAVFSQRGVSQPGHATCEPFQGQFAAGECVSVESTKNRSEV